MTEKIMYWTLGLGFGILCLLWAVLAGIALISGTDYSMHLVKELLCLIITNQYLDKAKG